MAAQHSRELRNKQMVNLDIEAIARRDAAKKSPNAKKAHGYDDIVISESDSLSTTVQRNKNAKKGINKDQMKGNKKLKKDDEKLKKQQLLMNEKQNIKDSIHSTKGTSEETGKSQQTMDGGQSSGVHTPTPTERQVVGASRSEAQSKDSKLNTRRGCCGCCSIL